jgi:hypothetical protein
LQQLQSKRVAGASFYRQRHRSSSAHPQHRTSPAQQRPTEHTSDLDTICTPAKLLLFFI